jgi:PAS domain S-box-containing protein
MRSLMMVEKENIHEKLLLAEQRLRLVLENSRDVVYQANYDTGFYEYVSPSMEEFSEYSAQELLNGGMEILSSLIHPADVQNLREHLQKIVDTNEGHQRHAIEYRFKTKLQGFRWVSDYRSIIRDSNNMPVSVLGCLRDVGDLKQSQLQIREIERRYRYIFEKNPIPMWAYDADTHAILMVNNAAKDKYGYSEEEFLAMSMEDVSQSRDNRKYFQHDSYEDTHSFTGERAHRKRDGSLMNVEVLSHIIYINGRLTRLIVAHDITERERATRALAFQANILKNVRESVMVTDLEGKITYWNEGAEKLFGYTTDEISGKNAGILRSPDDSGEFRGDLDNTLLKGAFHGEYCGLRKDGNIVWYEVRITPMHDLEDRVTGFIAIANDIGDRKAVYDKLEKSEANLRAIFDNTHKAFILLDKDYKVIAFNKMAAEGSELLFGRKITEGASILDFVKDEKLNYFRKGFEVAMKGEIVQAERRYRVDKAIKWFEFTYNPVLSTNAEHIGVCLGVMDVTERRQANDLVKEQNSGLKKLNAELDRFVYSASHDLRAPLSSVLGLIEIAEMEIKDPQPRHYFSMMKGSINRLNRFIQDIIDYSKNSRLEVEKEPIDFKEVVSEVTDDLKFLEGADKIRIGFDIDDSKVMLSDKGRIKILLSNLIGNSIKYHNLDQEEPRIRISTQINGRYGKINIEDNGIGIPEEHQAKIFDMFYRASYKSGGSGLGLYIVKEIVQKLHGSISVESQPGKGTKFSITLPLE